MDEKEGARGLRQCRGWGPRRRGSRGCPEAGVKGGYQLGPCPAVGGGIEARAGWQGTRWVQAGVVTRPEPEGMGQVLCV